MGFWNYSVGDNDLVQDVVAEYVTLSENEFPDEERAHCLEREWEADLQDDVERLLFWYGVAIGALECGAPAESHIETIRVARLGLNQRALSNYSEIEKLLAAVDRFVGGEWRKIKRKRSQSKRPAATPLLDAGACIAVTVGAHQYGGAVVMQSRRSSARKLWYRLVPIKYRGGVAPSLQDFEKKDWIIEDRSWSRDRIANDPFKDFSGQRAENWPDRPHHNWCDQGELEANRQRWSLVGKVALSERDPVVPKDAWLGEYFADLGGLEDIIKHYD